MIVNVFVSGHQHKIVWEPSMGNDRNIWTLCGQIYSRGNWVIEDPFTHEHYSQSTYENSFTGCLRLPPVSSCLTCHYLGIMRELSR